MQNINPYIRTARPSIIPANHEIKMRIIFDYELIYIEKGGFVLTYDGTDYSVGEGQFVFIRPDIPHCFNGSKEEYSQPHIHFDFYYTEKSEEIPICFKNRDALSRIEMGYVSKDIFKKYPTIPFVIFSQKERALRLFYSIISDSNRSSLILKKAMLLEIIDMLISDNFPDAFGSDEEKNYNIAQHLKDYIDCGQGLNSSLDDFEKIFNYSKFYLEKLFKESYGVGVIFYRNSKRMEQAKHLLKTYSVSIVSEKLGFSSIYAFSRAFKKYYGISPSKIKEVCF